MMPITGHPHLSGKNRGQRGQSLAEFALVMPLLVALLVVILLLAWVGFSYVSITSAARMGTRHMMSWPQTPDDEATFANVDQEITHVVTTGMPFLDWHRAVISISPPIADRVPPCQVAIRVQYNTNLPTVRIPYVVRPGFFVLLPPIVLQAESRMQLE